MRGLFALYMVKIAHVFGHFINVKLVPVVIGSGNGRQIMKTICKLNIEGNDSQKEPEIKKKKKEDELPRHVNREGHSKVRPSF